jgi:hypothetical protein
MAKATAQAFVPKVFVPSRKQYAEAGIDYINVNGDPIKILPIGYKPVSIEDQERIEALVKRDPFCGICELGRQEMNQEARSATMENIALKHENEQLKAEFEEMRAKLAALQAAKA